MSAATTYEHIVLNSEGFAFIEGTTTKVVELIEEYKAYGWGPEQIHLQHPYLSLGQIYSAFAYYWDNADLLDREIKARDEMAEQIRRETETPYLREKLKSKGLL